MLVCLDCLVAGLLGGWAAELLDCLVLLGCWVAGLLGCLVAWLLGCWFAVFVDWWHAGLLGWCMV